MKVVFATATAVVGQTVVNGGTHWPATDPLVLANPSLFSEDPRWGLSYSAEPGDEEPEEEVVPDRKRAYARRG